MGLFLEIVSRLSTVALAGLWQVMASAWVGYWLPSVGGACVGWFRNKKYPAMRRLLVSFLDGLAGVVIAFALVFVVEFSVAAAHFCNPQMVVITPKPPTVPEAAENRPTVPQTGRLASLPALRVKGVQFVAPKTVGFQAQASVIVENQTGKPVYVHIWQEDAYWSYFNDRTTDSRVQEERWSVLEQYVRNTPAREQIVPSVFGSLTIPFETPAATQSDLEKFADRQEAFYLLMVITNGKGRRILELCQFFLSASPVTHYCNLHNGP